MAEVTANYVVAERAEIVPCEVGTYSTWSDDPTNPATSTAVRTPNPATATLDRTKCQPCLDNTYAPRKGEHRQAAAGGWAALGGAGLERAVSAYRSRCSWYVAGRRLASPQACLHRTTHLTD